MGKNLISVNILGVMIAGVVCLLDCEPASAMPNCVFPDGYEDLAAPCDSSPAGAIGPPTTCYVVPFGATAECMAIGFTNCNGNYCAGTYVAAVPELEDYAAAAFLVLALTIGWQVRRRQQMT